MKKLIITATILSGFLLSACDSKEKKMAYYEDKQNEQEFLAMSNKCAFNVKGAKDCDILMEINMKREKAFQDKYGIKK